MSSKPRLILTRPSAQAGPLAQRLTEMGYPVVIFPLLEIAALPENSALQLKLQSVLANLKRYAIAAFVSPNAIHAVFSNGLAWPAEVAIAIMGEGSRHALAEYGIDDSNTSIISPSDPFRSDSETLLENLDCEALRGKEAVIFRSESGRELLADALLARGVHVDKVVAYQRLVPTLTSQHVNQLTELLSCSGYWIVSSSEALRTLEQMVMHELGAKDVVKMHQMNLWVSHQRIAQNAENSGFKHVRLIGSGDENLLLALQSCP